ncbi:MAG TPA: MotA/TolQ/ExbB proton channel family protein, partial [Methylophaga aminisulfidivorans]|nr:MotA/TolQ/ExbB proton channel family protein [Methylophaga aminisulfidivorans]
MFSLSDNLFQVQLLLESGGAVLWIILLTSIVMWSLIIERYIYVFFYHPKQVKSWIETWQQRQYRTSWFAQQIRQGLIAESRVALQ